MLGARTVVVTGGTKGIGASISRAFHASGAHVLIGARRDSGVATELGDHARFLAIDVRRRIDHHLLLQTALEWTDRIDVYVNCAGLSEWRALPDADEAFWDLLIDTNLKGTFFGCQVAAEHLQRGGVILNVSSLAGKRGSAYNAVYCASKFGVNGLTQALAKELGTRGVRVNAVCPVFVETEALLESLERTHPQARVEGAQPYLRAFAEQHAALGTLPTVEQVAQVCLFLASPAASAITGQCVIVDCGVFPQ